MTDEPETPQPETPKPEDLQNLWQDQPTEFAPMSLQAIHTRANQFQSHIFMRNALEYAASVFVAGIFGWFAWQSDDPVFRLACGLIIASAAFICLFLFLNGRADRTGAKPDDDCLAFHRNALHRQSRLLRGAWLWYVLPMVPGMSLFMWAVTRNLPTDKQWPNLLVSGLVAIAFIAVGVINIVGARWMDKELKRLED